MIGKVKSLRKRIRNWIWWKILIWEIDHKIIDVYAGLPRYTK